jgi:hypothetical protein
MAMHSKAYSITTAADGSATLSITQFYGVIEAIAVRLGSLDTPDVTITDGLSAGSVLAVSGLATDKRYHPRVLAQDDSGANITDNYTRPAISGQLKIVIAGGGNKKTGSVIVVWED